MSSIGYRPIHSLSLEVLLLVNNLEMAMVAVTSSSTSRMIHSEGKVAHLQLCYSRCSMVA